MQDIIDLINERFDRIEDMIRSNQTGNLGRGRPPLEIPDNPEALFHQRKIAVEEKFWSIVNASREKRERNYHSPSYLLEGPTENNFEGVLLSVIANQLRTHSVFACEPDPRKFIREFVTKTALVLVSAQDLDDTARDTPVVVSPGLAHARGLVLPEDCRPWSIPPSRRGKPRTSLAGEPVHPHPDPVYPSPADAEEHAPKKKSPRLAF